MEETINIFLVEDDFDFSKVNDDKMYITKSNWKFIENYAKENGITVDEAFSRILRSMLEKNNFVSSASITDNSK